MITEAQCLKLVQLEISIRCGSITWRVLGLTKQTLLLAGAATLLYHAWSQNIDSIRDLVTSIMWLMEGVMFLVDVSGSLLTDADPYSDLRQIDQQLNLADTSNSKDFTIHGLLLMEIFTILPRIYSFSLNFPAVTKWGMIGTSLCVTTVLKATFLKHLVAKRLIQVRTADSSVKQLIANSRLILAFNNDLNNRYTTTLAAFELFIIPRCLNQLYLLWLIGFDYNNDYSLSYFVLTFPLYLVILFLALLSSYVVDEIDNINLTLDELKAEKRCSQKQKMIISAFLMELHNSPIQFSAFDLFTINRNSLTEFCASMMTYLLVMIQFSQKD